MHEPGDAPEVPGFDLERLIGRGAQGCVYLATTRDALRRRVAVKVFPAGARRDYSRELEIWRRIEEVRVVDTEGRIVEGIASARLEGGGLPGHGLPPVR